MRNMEISGMVAAVSVKPDGKNNGQLCMSVTLVEEDGKPVQAKVLSVNDTVHGLPRGKEVLLRFEDIGWLNAEFGKITGLRSQAVKIVAVKEVPKAS